jgi:hypothetical protein
MHLYHPYTRPSCGQRSSKFSYDRKERALYRPPSEAHYPAENPFRIRTRAVFPSDKSESEEGSDNRDEFHSPSLLSSSARSSLAEGNKYYVYTMPPMLSPMGERREVFPDFRLHYDGVSSITPTSPSSSTQYLESWSGSVLASWPPPAYRMGKDVSLPSIHSLDLPGLPLRTAESICAPDSSATLRLPSPAIGFQHHTEQETNSLGNIDPALIEQHFQALPPPPTSDKQEAELPPKEDLNARIQRYTGLHPDKSVYCKECLYVGRRDMVRRHIKTSHLDDRYVIYNVTVSVMDKANPSGF